MYGYICVYMRTNFSFLCDENIINICLFLGVPYIHIYERRPRTGKDVNQSYLSTEPSKQCTQTRAQRSILMHQTEDEYTWLGRL